MKRFKTSMFFFLGGGGGGRADAADTETGGIENYFYLVQ